LRGSASAYYYEIDKLISQVLDPSDGLLVYRNGDKINAKGLELTLEGKLPSGWDGRLSYAIQGQETVPATGYSRILPSIS
jgi:outer membrane receptor protein involved in Fe transport